MPDVLLAVVLAVSAALAGRLTEGLSALLVVMTALPVEMH